jgi:hypothetical protein
MPELLLDGGYSSSLVHEVSDMMPEAVRVNACDSGLVGDSFDDIGKRLGGHPALA